MYHNPDETTEPMEELQPRPPVPSTPAAQPPGAPPPYAGAAPAFPSMGGQIEETEAHTREEALTIKFAIGKLNDYIQWFLMVLETILAIRFLLRMFGADPANIFATFVFSLTQILLVPFDGIVPSLSIHANQAFELSTLIAMAVYFLIFYALKRFLRILISNPEEPVE